LLATPGPRPRPTDDRSVIIGSAIACFILLACVGVAAKLCWPGESADNGRHEHMAKAR